MTAFTLLHTGISILPVGLGLAAFARHGKIDPKTRLGKWYIGTMIAGAVSGFGFIWTLGFTPGQALGLVTLALLAVGTLTLRGHWRDSGYLQTAALSASYFMLMVFTTTEALKRFPASRPFASGPADPSLIPVRLALVALFAIGVAYQLLTMRLANRSSVRLDRILAAERRAA